MDFPQELMDLKQWTVWKLVERDGKTTKVPIDPITGELAKSNDPSTWRSFGEALEVFKTNEHVNGLGFFFKAPYIGIDLDNIAGDMDDFFNGNYDNKVFEFYEGFKSYGEISPSGNGIHIITKGSIPGTRRRKGNVEIYQEGRFFTMTGNSLRKYKAISEASEETFKRIYNKYFGEDKVINLPYFKSPGVTHNLSDSEVVRKILESKQSQQFQNFMYGGWENHYTSQSEADLAFANLLAFWCARDFFQMDSLFRQSAMYRSKWDEKRGKTTYGEATLYRAINDTSNVFTPYDAANTEQALPKYNLGFLTGDAETQEVFPSIVKKNQYPPRSWDDTGNGQRFLDRYGDIVKYTYVKKKFYVYDGTVWKEDNEGLVYKLMDLVVEDMKNETIKVSDDMDEEEAMKAWKKHVKASRSNRAKKSMLEEIKHNVSILPEHFDSNDMLLNLENGYLDLTSGKVMDHDKEKLFSMKANAEYSDKYSPDTWLSFLNDIFAQDQDMINFLQRAVGYSLTGSAKEQVMFILLGKGRNGKSLFVNTLSTILGNYASNIQASTIQAKRGNSEGPNNDVARLETARFVTSSEPSEGFTFDEGMIKQMTGDDKITARYLHQENFEFEAKFKLWLATNHRPIIRGTDDGIWRRPIVIPFEVQIPKNKVDKNLKYKLLREAPAILDWALEGCLLWQREGWTLPAKVVEANNEYRKNMDITEAYIEECCELGEEFEVYGKELYDNYAAWCRRNGQKDLGGIEFGKRMKDKFQTKRSNGIKYLGIGIIPDSRLNWMENS